MRTNLPMSKATLQGISGIQSSELPVFDLDDAGVK